MSVSKEEVIKIIRIGGRKQIAKALDDYWKEHGNWKKVINPDNFYSQDLPF